VAKKKRRSSHHPGPERDRAAGQAPPHLLALGIKRHQQSVIHDDTPAIRGMINQIGYLLDVQEVD
jgi:hypothetical protein